MSDVLCICMGDPPLPRSEYRATTDTTIDRRELRELCASLARIEGQLRGIQRMVGAERTCHDLLQQTHAVSASLRRVGSRLFSAYVMTHVAVRSARARAVPAKLPEA